MDKIAEFKALYGKFLEATRYMVKKRQEWGRSPEFERLEEKFLTRVVEPMDKAWRELTVKERAIAFAKPEDDPQVKEALKIFNGTIVTEDGKCELT